MSQLTVSRNRRQFMEEVGSGMLLAGLGTALAGDMGFSTAFAKEGIATLDFGALRPMVRLMQETAPEKLQPMLVKKLKAGETDLKQLVAAGALANAESFGGQDYVGFHTEMAFAPAYAMSQQLPKDRQALPVLKVLYRNADQIQKEGGAKHITLHPIEPKTKRPANDETGRALRDVSREAKIDEADEIFASTADQSPEVMFQVLHQMVQDDMNVHRFVMAHRTYALIKLVGQEHAHTLLRQSVRLCAHHEQNRITHKGGESPIRKLMPKLIDQYKLAGKQLGKRQVDDKWVADTAEAIYTGGERAADVVAAALAEGIDPESVGEAISLAANALVLRQPASKGRTHGDSMGVHGSDAMNAWRNMSRVLKGQLAITGLIVAAYHTAAFGVFNAPAYPLDEHRKAIKTTEAKALLAEAEDAIRQNDQGRAAAAIAIYTEQKHPVRPVFDLMLRYAVSEDGRLHAEKYYHTVTEEYGTTRPAFRSRQLVALARVTASAYSYNRVDQKGFRAAGYEEACRLLEIPS